MDPPDRSVPSSPGDGSATKDARATPLSGRRFVVAAAGTALPLLVVAALLWLMAAVLMRVALASFTVAVALLLSALLQPITEVLHRRRLPHGLAALLAVMVLVGVPACLALLLWARVGAQTGDLVRAVTAGLDSVGEWLVSGPLSLDTSQVDNLRDKLVDELQGLAPDPVTGATTVLQLLTAVALALFIVFFLLKDGKEMWRWALARTPEHRRGALDGAGRAAWGALTGYMTGVTLVALADAVLIGAGLAVLRVPLWLSLTLLTFVAAYVPVLGAAVAGAVAALVTAVTNGPRDAVLVIVVVLVVQQIEGNVFQPLIMRKAVSLHPVVSVLAVTCGTLLLGVPGAVLAVPVVAVVYAVAEHRRCCTHTD